MGHCLRKVLHLLLIRLASAVQRQGFDPDKFLIGSLAQALEVARQGK